MRSTCSFIFQGTFRALAEQFSGGRATEKKDRKIAKKKYKKYEKKTEKISLLNLFQGGGQRKNT